MTDAQEPPDFDDTPPLKYTLSVVCVGGKISWRGMADRRDMDLITAQGCVDVVKGRRDT
jgi:hypothetical protein